MATLTQYQISLNGWAIGEDGQISEDQSNIASFSSLEDIFTFIEASGSNGTYSVHTFIIKS